jgi:hypothetical protein
VVNGLMGWEAASSSHGLVAASRTPTLHSKDGWATWGGSQHGQWLAADESDPGNWPRAFRPGGWVSLSKRLRARRQCSQREDEAVDQGGPQFRRSMLSILS